MAQTKKQPVPAPKPASKPAAATKAATPTQQPANPLLLIGLALAGIAVLAYINTLGLGYALDDFTVIKNNSIVTKGISAIPEILSTPYRRGWFITTNDLYRPLSLVMFATEWQLGGGEPGAGHFMNVLVYAGSVFFLFTFLHRFFEGKRLVAATVATLLFALHPLHTEVVANIKSRDELLCFFFAFASLNVYLNYMTHGKTQQLLLASLLFFLSFLSKETVISFLFVIPFVFVAYHNSNKTRTIAISISAVVVTILFLALRFAVLRSYNANTTSEVSFIDNFLTKAPNAASGFATEVLILGQYLLQLVVPNPLVCDYCYNSIPYATIGNVWVIASLVAYLALAVTGIYRLVKFRKDPYAFAILFFLSTLALFSNIPFLIGAAKAERFLFFASAGFCLAIALLLEQLVLRATETGMPQLRDGKVLAFVVPVALIFGGITMGRNGDWADN
ncbi:MAG: hypothetical protein EBZ77_15375, partial [Chitinophagia bacterium]|nr:hypothetical protein [Chitinophagia bacterium]